MVRLVGVCLVPSPHYTKFAMNKKWWVGQPQGEEEGWDMEGNTEGRGGRGVSEEWGGEGGEGVGGGEGRI